MTLHLLNKSPDNRVLTQRMLSALSEGDVILLIEDGVYGAMHAQKALYEQHLDTVELYALQPDVEARGLSAHLNPAFRLISDREFVQLSCRQEKVVSWF